ncbi:MAG: adenosine deaminase [Nitrososphaeria archaeon]
MKGIREKIEEMEKAELHLHLDGSLRLGTMIDIARKEGVRLPSDDREQLGRSIRFRRGITLTECIDRFKVTLSVMQWDYALERIARELCEDLSRENVTYAEIRYCPTLHLDAGLSAEEVVEAVARGLESGKDTGVTAHQIFCCLREEGPERSVEMVKQALKHRGLGVVGVDLAGDEHGHPPEEHKQGFELARRHSMKRTVHAGEALERPENVEIAFRDLHADRLGHAVALIGNPRLMEEIRDAAVTLELCPTSNLQTGVVDSYTDHPLKEFLRCGLKVSVSSDNRMFSNTTVTDELTQIAIAQGLSLDDVEEIVENSFEGRFGV